ncbi:MAG: hypothetical protein CMJ32_09425 [Phycisphaerae bacterium]|nr:hypothetical protein [Phycisphaerae bacterium]
MDTGMKQPIDSLIDCWRSMLRTLGLTPRPPHLAAGRRGESIACLYLQLRGYRILGRNIRLRTGEIDILAMDRSDSCLVIVEVKTTSGGREPLDRLGTRQLRRLHRSAALIRGRHWPTNNARVDCIGICLGWPGSWRLKHLIAVTDRLNANSVRGRRPRGAASSARCPP